VSPNTSDLSHQKPCDLKEMFLQLSLSPGDLMKKGNVFTNVLIFWRPDEKEMFLQLSLSSGDLMKKGNVFTNVLIF
jgi:hypothetical protein